MLIKGQYIVQQCCHLVLLASGRAGHHTSRGCWSPAGCRRVGAQGGAQGGAATGHAAHRSPAGATRSLFNELRVMHVNRLTAGAGKCILSVDMHPRLRLRAEAEAAASGSASTEQHQMCQMPPMLVLARRLVMACC